MIQRSFKGGIPKTPGTSNWTSNYLYFLDSDHMVARKPIKKKKSKPRKKKMETKRYFECKTGGHNKFWEIVISPMTGGSGNGYLTFYTRYGKIGATGTYSSAKTFMRQADINTIVNEKLNKGYKEVLKDSIGKSAKPKENITPAIKCDITIYED